MQGSPDWIELVEAARAGDRDALGSLLLRFEPLARSTAHRLVRPQLVDDVVQESFAAAVAGIDRLRTAGAFPAWFRLIVRKQAGRHRAGDADRPLEAAPERRAEGPDPLEVVADREVAEVVRIVLATARDQDRRLLELRYLAGWSNEELAAVLGIGPGALRKRLHDARRRLRPRLEHLEHPHAKEHDMTDHRSFLGLVHRPDIAVPVAAGLGAAGPDPTVTGLKVVDTMAPIRRGGTIEMVGPAGTGHLVVTLELLYRLGRTEHGTACVGVGRSGAAIGSQPDLGCLVDEDGIPGPNAVILAAGDGDSRRAFEAGTRLAAGLATTGLDVILAVDRPTLGALAPSDLVSAAGLASEGSVTVVALNTLDRGEPEPDPIGLDATLVFSVEHLALGVFPAIDGSRSTSSLAITPAARDAKERLTNAAALRTLFDQPMFVAKPHTGVDGTWCEPADTESELSSLLA